MLDFADCQPSREHNNKEQRYSEIKKKDEKKNHGCGRRGMIRCEDWKCRLVGLDEVLRKSTGVDVN
jgi:hypothetical protein